MCSETKCPKPPAKHAFNIFWWIISVRHKTERMCPIQVSVLHSKRLHIWEAPWFQTFNDPFWKKNLPPFLIFINAGLQHQTLGNSLALGTQGEVVTYRLAQSKICGPRERQYLKCTFTFSVTQWLLEVSFYISHELWCILLLGTEIYYYVEGMSFCEPGTTSKISRFLCEEGIFICKWIEIGYLFSPLEDSSYFGFKALEMSNHTCLVPRTPSYFGEDSSWLPPKWK